MVLDCLAQNLIHFEKGNSNRILFFIKMCNFSYKENKYERVETKEAAAYRSLWLPVSSVPVVQCNQKCTVMSQRTDHMQ